MNINIRTFFFLSQAVTKIFIKQSRIAGSLSRDEVTQQKVLRLMAGLGS